MPRLQDQALKISDLVATASDKIAVATAGALGGASVYTKYFHDAAGFAADAGMFIALAIGLLQFAIKYREWKRGQQ